jgi:hypothetical protein
MEKHIKVDEDNRLIEQIISNKKIKDLDSITSILNEIEDNSSFTCNITFLIENNKISAIGLGLDLKIKTTIEDTSVLSNLISFNNDFSKLRFELFKNGELIKESNQDTDIITKICNMVLTNANTLIMINPIKGLVPYQTCDMFQASLYNGDDLLLEECWEAI